MGSKHMKETFEDANGEFTISIQNRDFCDEYLANGYNARQAYKKVRPNLKESSYNAMASRCLYKDECQRYIAMRRNELYKIKCVDALRVLDELSEIGFAPKGDEEYTAQCKLKALELLGKHFQMFDKQQEKQENNTIHITIEE